MNNLHHPLTFVPTMGALHRGHESLIEIARKISDEVLVSVFVNPLQFDSQEDLENYPRSQATDTERALAAGATQVWFPTNTEIYPGDIERLNSGELGTKYEGASRSGHFDGMLTVVKRLFDLTQPESAIFGEKDFQQLFLVRQMVAQLNLPINIVAAPLIRDDDGLALSSRNVRLDDDARASALVISRALRLARSEETLARQRATLYEILATEPSFTVDYVEIIDEISFSPAVTEETQNRALVAGWGNGIRLLDNMVMNSRKVGQ